MGQMGRLGESTIQAWAVGARGGYTLQDFPWTPRMGLQIDNASGDRHRNDDRLGTFNPLFPNGYYFTAAGLTGYSNLLHLKASVSTKPAPRLTILAALGLQWRSTTADAIYLQGMAPLPRSAGRGDSWTGSYEQLRVDNRIDARFSGAVEAVRFIAGDAIRSVGGRSSNYLGLELKFSW